MFVAGHGLIQELNINTDESWSLKYLVDKMKRFT